MPVKFSLSDDGTLDTVVECYCPECKRTWDERFSTESAWDYRDETGAMVNFKGFIADNCNDIYCEECEGE